MSDIGTKTIFIIRSVHPIAAKATLNAVMDTGFNVLCWVERSHAEGYARAHGLLRSVVVERDLDQFGAELGLFAVRHGIKVGVRLLHEAEPT